MDIYAAYSGFQVLNSSLCQWNLDSGFQSLVGSRIPRAKISRIPNTTSKNLPDSWSLDSLTMGRMFAVALPLHIVFTYLLCLSTMFVKAV